MLLEAADVSSGAPAESEVLGGLAAARRALLDAGTEPRAIARALARMLATGSGERAVVLLDGDPPEVSAGDEEPAWTFAVPEELVARFADVARRLVVLRSASGARACVVVPLDGAGGAVGVARLTCPTTALSRERLAFVRELCAQAGLVVDAAVRGRAAARSRDELVALVSHELRNALTLVAASTEVAARGLELPDGTARVRQALERAGRSTEGMRRLVDDLLDASALCSGQLTLRHGSYDAGSLAREALLRAAPLAETRNITLRGDVPTTPVDAVGDGPRLALVLDNLLGNALKHTPAGGAVRLALEEHGDALELSVRDDGPGIPAARRQLVFRRGWCDGPERGMGLGLYVAQCVVERHGGRIWIDGAPGGGTLVRVRLPRTVAAPLERQGVPSSEAVPEAVLETAPPGASRTGA